MDDIAIRVEGLGKRFRLRHTGGGPRYRTFREDLLGMPGRLLAALRGRRDEQEEFWALRDVSFEVKRGEVLGIIGRNGAGKSTLLKVLSRIMDPTCGEATVYGRIGSLLEVGTGFHPELTGRENIFLSGALLGMRRDEVRRRFDEIVAFAGVEKFLDTPCKHYSSGMYARLGFAVAAHLDAEILLIDEVLAVGDAEFQKKCSGKVSSIAKQGRTVLFVTHNLGIMEALCDRALVLQNGICVTMGEPSTLINQYISRSADISEGMVDLTKHDRRSHEKQRFLRSLRLLVDGRVASAVPMGQGFVVEVEYAAGRQVSKFRLGIAINDHRGVRVVNFSPSHQAPDLLVHAPSTGRVICNVLACNLLPDQYTITVIAADSGADIDRADDCLAFQIIPADVFETGQIPSRQHGQIFLNACWRLESGAEKAR